MTIEQLNKMHEKRPFQPFDIHLADGRSLPVEHPEFLARSPAGRTIMVGLTDGTFEIVDLLLVTSLKSRSNGVPQRRRKSR
ncbi:MAG: hypothetical protein WD851_15405 [Pirellulales bacterium]